MIDNISASRFYFDCDIVVPYLQVEWVLNGTWDSKMEGSKVIGEAFVKGKSSLGMASCFRFCFLPGVPVFLFCLRILYVVFMQKPLLTSVVEPEPEP